MGKDVLVEVGAYIESFNLITGQDLPCGPIMQSSGLCVHIQKHHPDIATFIDLIPQIIEFPDFVGHNPKEVNSIELVKQLEKNLMVCVKLDSEKGYLYVASLYDVTGSKIESRIKSGRLKRYLKQA